MTLLDDRTLVRAANSRPSTPLVTLAGVSLAGGIAIGGWLYADRSPVHQHFTQGTSAWPAHLVVAVVTLAAAVVLVRRRGLSGALRLIVAPITVAAATRLRRTCGTATSARGSLRFLLAVPPAALLLYLPFRMGIQIVAGLDPNFTVNAWGGPTYAGAMACHYLDAVPLAAAAVWLLDKLLLAPTGAGAGASRSG